jgi:hypothetical protein
MAIYILIKNGLLEEFQQQTRWLDYKRFLQYQSKNVLPKCSLSGKTSAYIESKCNELLVEVN